MANIKPFHALRPTPERVAQVAALPYDVMSSQEAQALVKDNPYSFLHVEKADIDLDPGIAPNDPRVYATARKNLQQLIADGILRQDQIACFYIYREVWRGKSQTGLIGCSAIDD
jgi:uncharacterized protein (DUF1015 family)